MKMLYRAFLLHLLRALVLCTFLRALAPAQVSVLTHHNDTRRTGANISETILNVGNVNVNQFGKLFSQPVDAFVYAQPLYVPNVAIPGQGTHNVVYVATMNDSVYAFDADSNTGSNSSPLWQVNFTNPAAGITSVPAGPVDPLATDIVGTIGVESTPVIDPTTNTMYLIAQTLENGTYVQRLHALDITTGAEKFNGPTAIQATVNGPNGPATFDPQWGNQRVSLALANGQIYTAWASHNDYGYYHGWVMAYSASTLQQTAVWNDTIAGNAGGIWQSGQAPAVDSSGNIYLGLGNGDWDGVNNFGSSVVKLSPSLTLLDWFTPDNYLTLNAQDLDLGNSGPLLIPNTNLLLTGGKQGILYLLNTNSFGHEVSGNGQIPQSFLATDGHIHGSPAYWVSPTLGPLVYVQGEYDYLKAYHFNGSTLDTTPIMQNTIRDPDGMPGGFISLSSNGAQPGTGIAWVSTPLFGDAVHATVQGVLRAYDASNLSNELWDTQQNPGRDDIGNFAKFVMPTVANGKVYMATFSNQLVVYGLLSQTSNFTLLSPGPSQSVAPGSTVGYTVAVTPPQGGSFNGNVSFSASNLPAGVSATFSPASLTGAGSTFVSVSAASSTAPGTYSFNVTANSGSGSQTVSLQLTVNPQAVGIGAGSHSDIGGPPAAGTSSVSSGVYTIAGSGQDIWGTSDQFQFTYWLFPGDGILTARVVSPANASIYSKSGLMFRSTLDADSAYAFLAGLPSIYAFQYRNGAAASSATSPYLNATYPLWVRLVRANGNFTGYVSPDGTNWTQVGDTVSVPMPQTVYVGLAVCSETNQLATATFDNVSITPATNGNPDYTLTMNPLTPTILAGDTATIATSITGVNGFSGAVTFAAEGVPSGATVAVNPSSVNGTGTATLSVSTPATIAPGFYPITVQAINGSMVRDQTVTVQVGNFTLAAASANNTSNATISAGNSATFTITDFDGNDYSGLASLAISGLPSGATATFEPAAVSRETQSIVTVYTSPSTPAGTYTLVISGTSATQVSTVPITLTVESGPDFSLSATVPTQTIQPGGTATFGASTTALNGFSSNVSFSVVGLPNGATASITPSAVTASGSAAITIQTATNIALGTYSLTIVATSGSLSHSASVKLVVTAAAAAFGQGAGTDLDIGNPANAGSASLSGSVYTVSGGGQDIWTNSDQFNFNYWPVSGDGIWTVRVTSDGNTSFYAKAGLMIRETLNANSDYALITTVPTINAFQYRTAAGNYSYSTAYFPTTYPIWLRLVRANSNFTAYTSEDGNTWTQVGTAVSINMASSVYVGLAVTAQSPTGLNTATFDNLSFVPLGAETADFTLTSSAPIVSSITPGQTATFPIAITPETGFTGTVTLSAPAVPAGLTVSISPSTITTSGTATVTVTTASNTPITINQIPIYASAGNRNRTTSVTLITSNPVPNAATAIDIGSPAIAGSATFANGVYTITAGGIDIWGISDQFTFDYWQISGNMTITARVTGLQNTSIYAKAGVMIRSTLDPGSPYALALVDPGLMNFDYRVAEGTNAIAGTYINSSFPMWVRLIYFNNQLSSYSSPDGNNWTQIGSPVAINLGFNVYAGLAVTSETPSQSTTATFDNVTVTTP